MIQPIETVYNNYRFRSRLEARWAVFFDTAGIKYEYEYEGWNLGHTYYLPDFWLPELDTWIEVKGSSTEFQPEHDRKLAMLTTHKGWFGLMLVGTPDHLQQEHYGYFAGVYVGKTSFASCIVCHQVGLLTTPFLENFSVEERIPPYFYRLRCNCRNEVAFPFASTNSRRIDDAFIKARQARFEFGENG